MNAGDEWVTSITEVTPGKILVRGYRIEELIGRVPFSHLAYLILRGDLPPENHGRVMDAILASCADHGVKPPSILAARTVASGGAPLTTAVAAGIMAINRYHGGAIEGCMKLLIEAVRRKRDKGVDALVVARETFAECRAQRKRIPGYGHRTHAVDPRAKRLIALAEKEGLSGEYVEMGLYLGQAIKEGLGRELPLNVDGAIAILLCEMGFPPEVGNGLFAMGRIVGLVAHVYEEQTRMRPMRSISPELHRYDGPQERKLE